MKSRMYWDSDALVLEVQKSRIYWALIDYCHDGGALAHIQGWKTWPPMGGDESPSLYCESVAEARRVVVALAKARGFTIGRKPRRVRR